MIETNPVKASKRDVANVIRGLTKVAISWQMSPERAWTYFGNLDRATKANLTYLFGGPADASGVDEAVKVIRPLILGK